LLSVKANWETFLIGLIYELDTSKKGIVEPPDSFGHQSTWYEHFNEYRIDGKVKTPEQYKLIEYFAGRNESKFTLRLHNNYTRFAPKQKKNDVIIPFITHTVWFTNPEKPR